MPIIKEQAKIQGEVVLLKSKNDVTIWSFPEEITKGCEKKLFGLVLVMPTGPGLWKFQVEGW